MSFFTTRQKEAIRYIEHEIIGQIPIKVHARAKSLKLKASSKGISITSPKYVALKTIKAFFEANEDWAIKQFHKIKTSENQHEFKIGDKLQIGEGIAALEMDKIIWSLSGSERVFLVDFKSTEVVKNILVELCRSEAKRLLTPRIELLAKTVNVSFNKLTFKRIKTRWGSCSSRDNINLSIFLVRLPQELSDYVILHELCHIVHKNHSKDFWNLLEKWYPNSKYFDKQLRNYNHVII